MLFVLLGGFVSGISFVIGFYWFYDWIMEECESGIEFDGKYY